MDERIGVIGGTGLGDVLSEHIEDLEYREVDTPFGPPSGPIGMGTLGTRRVAFLNRHGQGHRFGPSQVPYRANLFALKSVGVRSILASGAVGSLREEYAPMDLVIVDQFIDKTCKRAGSFFADFGAVHVEFSHPCTEPLREALLNQAGSVDTNVHAKGTYVCMEGPAFSTRAESLMHRAWGGDLIGMTAMPEAKLAREAQMGYALVALVSDYDCWREHDISQGKHELLREIISNLQAATQNAISLIEAVLSDDAVLCSDEWDDRKSLEMAVWSKEAVMDSKQREALSVLFE